MKVIFVLLSIAFSFAKSKASFEISSAVTFASRLFLSAIAIHPLPVPKSIIFIFLLNSSLAYLIVLSTSNSVSNLGISTLSSTFIVCPKNSTLPIKY